MDYLDPEALEDPTNTIYELKSIIIHRGGAFGGHYYAYIQDELKEGEWYLEMPAEFQKLPKVVEKVKYDPKKFMTEEQIKQAEADKNKADDPTVQINVDDEVVVPNEKVVENGNHDNQQQN